MKIQEVVGVIFFFFVSDVCVLCITFVDLKKNTALVRGYAKVQRPCISFILLHKFLLTEACFNVYRFVAVTYFSTIVFVCVSLLVVK